jgi:branched-chain amino acid transport system ATP-binding protein
VFVDHWIIVLGAIFVATVFVAPRGVIGWFTRAPSSGTVDDDGEPIYRGKEVSTVSEGPAVPTSAFIPPASDSEVVLSLEGLTKAFGGMLAVRDAAFEVRRGERVAILGPNGAGKSSLFNLVSGHLTATRGRVSLFGRDVSRLRADQRARVGLGRTFQITNLFPTLSVIDNLRIALGSAHGRRFVMHRFATSFADSDSEAQRHLKDAGLWPVRHRLVQSLSYGEQRQLEFVMALALGPRLLLLDEPTAGLSPGESRLIVDLVHRLDRSLTLLIIEHDLDVALAIAERVIVFHFGEQIADGTPQQIRDNPTVREIYLGGLASAG